MLLHSNIGICIPKCVDCKNLRIRQNQQTTLQGIQIINESYCIYNCSSNPIEPCNGFICKYIQGIPYLADYMVWKDVEDAEFKELEIPALESNQTETQQNDKET